MSQVLIRGSVRHWGSTWTANRRVQFCLTKIPGPSDRVYFLTEYIWGVIDMVPSPETNFPDYRNRCAIHSENGSCMIIPREDDKIRLYLQLTNADVVDPATGRVDMNRFGPDKLLEVCRTRRRSSLNKNRFKRKPKFLFRWRRSRSIPTS